MKTRNNESGEFSHVVRQRAPLCSARPEEVWQRNFILSSQKVFGAWREKSTQTDHFHPADQCLWGFIYLDFFRVENRAHKMAAGWALQFLPDLSRNISQVRYTSKPTPPTFLQNSTSSDVNKSFRAALVWNSVFIVEVNASRRLPLKSSSQEVIL